VRPLKNMMEYAGIDASRLEAMEERLKKDVLAEVGQGGLFPGWKRVFYIGCRIHVWGG
jgi:hypothetical protein